MQLEQVKNSRLYTMPVKATARDEMQEANHDKLHRSPRFPGVRTIRSLDEQCMKAYMLSAERERERVEHQ